MFTFHLYYFPNRPIVLFNELICFSRNFVRGVPKGIPECAAKKLKFLSPRDALLQESGASEGS